MNLVKKLKLTFCILGCLITINLFYAVFLTDDYKTLIICALGEVCFIILFYLSFIETKLNYTVKNTRVFFYYLFLWFLSLILLLKEKQLITDTIEGLCIGLNTIVNFSAFFCFWFLKKRESVPKKLYFICPAVIYILFIVICFIIIQKYT